MDEIAWNVDQFGQLYCPSLHDGHVIEIEHVSDMFKFVIQQEAILYELEILEVEDLLIDGYRGGMGVLDVEIWNIDSMNDVLWDRSRIAWRKLLGATDRTARAEFEQRFGQRGHKKLLYLSGHGDDAIICVCGAVRIGRRPLNPGL